MDSKLKEQFTNFLLKKPLYSKWKLDNNGTYLVGYNEFEDETFTSNCKECSLQTFILSPLPNSHFKASKRAPNTVEPNSLMKNIPTTINLKIFQEYVAKCQGCKEYELRFNFRLVKTSKETFIEKIGQYPPYNKEVDKDLKNFLDDENLGYYQKGLMNLSHGYGIGAFIYLRRVIEKEIHKLIDKISTPENPNQDKILAAKEKYQDKKQMSILIDKIFQYLPASLKCLGDNPIQLLYEQTSVGIHGLSDDECAERSESIDEILKKVVKELNREKIETQKVKDAIFKLKSYDRVLKN